VLAVFGGVAGLGVAFVLHGALVRMMAESDRYFRMGFALDLPVLAFALASTLAAALAFGVLPALQASRAGIGSSLQESSRSLTGSLARIRSGRFLVCLQLALCVPLLVGAGLLARTLYNLQRMDLGFSAESLMLVRVDSRQAGYEGLRRDRLHRDLRAGFQQIPGVRAVSFSQLGVFSGGTSTSEIEVDFYAPQQESDRSSAMDVVGPDYFSTLGIPIALGREIQEGDAAGAPRVCVINEAFARHYFVGRNPIGMRVTEVNEGKRTPYQVVGVARNAHTAKLRGEIEPRFFIAAQQHPQFVKSPTFVVRTATEAAPVLAARRMVERTDPSLPIEYAGTAEPRIARLTALDRTTAELAVMFGCMALTLAAIGIYGVLSYGVARRTGEIAIRIAVGAKPGRVVVLILRETVGLVAAGLAVGAALAYVAVRLIDSRLFGVAPQDPLTLAFAAATLVLVALIAAYLPARRASRQDPMAALRQQ